MIQDKLSGNAISYLRFSSIEQSSGDSLRRQKKTFKKFIAKHDLTILKEIEDLGKSAYHDEHMTKGGLGAFIQAIEDGKVDLKSKPFYLIIENLDRFSRLNPHASLLNLLNLIDKNVNVITLRGKEKLYKNPTSSDSIMTALMELTRANEESETKSILIKEAYKEKWKEYRDGKGKKLNSYPKWFEQIKEEIPTEDQEDGKDKFHWVLKEIPERVELINRIFKLALVHGKPKICNILNAENIPTFTGNTWKVSGILNFFKDKRVLGHRNVYEMREDPETKRRKPFPTGEIIENFYPPILKSTLYENAQKEAIKRSIILFKDADHGRKIKRVTQGIGGRSGNKHNIFTGLLICIECGKNFSHYTSRYKSKTTDTVKIYHNCKCINYANAGGCTNKPLRFDYLEKIFFTFLKEIDFSLLFNEKNNNSRIKNIKNELFNIQKIKIETEKQIANLILLSSTLTTGNIKELAEQIDERNRKIAVLSNNEETLKHEILDINESINSSKLTINSMCNTYKIVMEGDNFEHKHQLHNLIREAIKGIVIDGHNKFATILLNKDRLRKAFLSTLTIIDNQMVFDINPDDFSETFLVRFAVNKDFYDLCDEISPNDILSVRNAMHPDSDYISKINKAIKLNNQYYIDNKYLKFGQTRGVIEHYDETVFDSFFSLADEQITKLVNDNNVDITVKGKQDLELFQSFVDDKNALDLQIKSLGVKDSRKSTPHFLLSKHANLFKIPESKISISENPYYEEWMDE
jgi:DNA invertase Pin-like site-specific DNA recombinase